MRIAIIGKRNSDDQKANPSIPKTTQPVKLLERLKTEQSADSHEPQIEGSKKPVSNFSGNLGMILAEGTLMTHKKKFLSDWNLTEHRELY